MRMPHSRACRYWKLTCVRRFTALPDACGVDLAPWRVVRGPSMSGLACPNGPQGSECSATARRLLPSCLALPYPLHNMLSCEMPCQAVLSLDAQLYSIRARRFHIGNDAKHHRIDP
jgi:hypothetical protein